MVRAFALLLMLGHCNLENNYPVVYIHGRDGIYPEEAAMLNGMPTYFVGWRHRF